MVLWRIQQATNYAGVAPLSRTAGCSRVLDLLGCSTGKHCYLPGAIQLQAFLSVAAKYKADLLGAYRQQVRISDKLQSDAHAACGRLPTPAGQSLARRGAEHNRKPDPDRRSI